MRSTPSLLTALACLAMGYTDTVAAATIEATLAGDLCSPYGGYTRSGTGWGIVGNVLIRAYGTGTYLDDIDGGITTVQVTQPQMNPYYYLALYNQTGVARMPIQCVDEKGLTERFSGEHLRISIWTQEALLTQKAYGLIPEPYKVTVDGVKLDGLFLGAAGNVRWAFKAETNNAFVIWRPRLLLKKDNQPDGDQLRDGEIAGYLKAGSG